MIMKLPPIPAVEPVQDETFRIANAYAAASFRLRPAAKALGMSPDKLTDKLREPDIAHAVAAKREELEDRTNCDLDWIVTRLMRMANFNMREIAEWGAEAKQLEYPDGRTVVMPGVYLVPSDRLTEAQAYAVAEIGNTREGVRIKGPDKQAALMSLAKIFGHITEKTESKTTVENVPIDLTKLNAEELDAYENLMIALAKRKEQP